MVRPCGFARYCLDDSEMHHNEKLIRTALETYPDAAVAAQAPAKRVEEPKHNRVLSDAWPSAR